MIRSPLYSSILYNRRYLSLIFPASCSADVTTAVTHDGEAGLKASGKKVAERQRENRRSTVEEETTTGRVLQLGHSSLCIANHSLSTTYRA